MTGIDVEVLLNVQFSGKSPSPDTTGFVIDKAVSCGIPLQKGEPLKRGGLLL
ncbi:MAG TPA: hypothetical protein IAB57_02085 [Candidatus Fimivivens faecavium]|nr:hypothetical protein [Candidatus Fimivivens faecavium]